MKKHIFVIITAILVGGSFTACVDCSVPNGNFEDSEDQSLVNSSDNSGSSGGDLQSSGFDSSSNSWDNDVRSEPAEKVRVIYGETEIPNVSTSGLKFGTDTTYDQCIDSMVFETHELGDYKISLVGTHVWIDTEVSSDKILTNGLEIEVEKNGVKLEGSGLTSYKHEIWLGVPQYVTHTIIEDKIGSYLDVYDMDVPVIEMKYYFDSDISNAVNKVLMFATIQDGKIWSLFIGKCEEGTGLSVERSETGAYYYTMDGGKKTAIFIRLARKNSRLLTGKL